MPNRIKLFLRSDRLFFVLSILLIGITAYGLGLESASLQIDDSSEKQPAIVFVAARDGGVEKVGRNNLPVFASRGGTKYHLENCPGVRSIKESNLIRFDSTELARAAGYLPAGNCKELE